MARLITLRQFREACQELEQLVIDQAEYWLKQGYSFTITDEAPESYTELKAYAKSKRLPIASYGFTRGIYTRFGNTLFRFWHDCLHLEYNLSFSLVDEIETAQAHLSAAKGNGLSWLAIELLGIDTIEQVKHYYSQGEFVEDQLLFAYEQLIYKGYHLGFQPYEMGASAV